MEKDIRKHIRKRIYYIGKRVLSCFTCIYYIFLIIRLITLDQIIFNMINSVFFIPFIVFPSKYFCLWVSMD